MALGSPGQKVLRVLRASRLLSAVGLGAVAEVAARGS